MTSRWAWRLVFAGLVAAIISLASFAVVLSQNVYRAQVAYMTEYCRAEALLRRGSAVGANGPEVSCALVVWDGGEAAFNVTGSTARGFSCHIDEANFLFEKPRSCAFLDK